MEKFTVGYADLEKSLIENFKKGFYEQLGYYPIILTKDYRNEEKQIMSLEDLDLYFNRFYPRKKYSNKVVGLKDRSRQKEIVELRSIYIYLARSMNYKLLCIAKYLGMHHSTVIHNLHTFSDRMQTCESFRQRFKEIFEHIKLNYQPHDYIPAMEYFDQVWHQSRPTVLS